MMAAKFSEFLRSRATTATEEGIELVAEFVVAENHGQVRTVAARQNSALTEAENRIDALEGDLAALDAGDIDLAAFVERCRIRLNPNPNPQPIF